MTLKRLSGTDHKIEAGQTHINIYIYIYKTDRPKVAAR